MLSGGLGLLVEMTTEVDCDGGEEDPNKRDSLLEGVVSGAWTVWGDYLSTTPSSSSSLLRSWSWGGSGRWVGNRDPFQT